MSSEASGPLQFRVIQGDLDERQRLTLEGFSDSRGSIGQTVAIY